MKNDFNEPRKDQPKGDPKTINIQARLDAFQAELGPLQKKYAVELYAADVMLPNGEIVKMIKLRDVLILEIKK